MIRLASTLAVVAVLATPPAVAQQTGEEGEQDGMREGLGLIEEGMDMLLRGLTDEMRPMLEELEPQLRMFAMEIGPFLKDLSGLVDDLSAYESPEMLPNGDIIIRRKEPLEPAPQPETAPEDGVEL